MSELHEGVEMMPDVLPVESIPFEGLMPPDFDG